MIRKGYLIARLSGAVFALCPFAGTVPAAGLQDAAPLLPGAYTVVRPATLFGGPGLGAVGLRDLAVGTSVTVLAAIPGTNWVRVRDRAGAEGYLTAAALSGGPAGEAVGTSAVPGLTGDGRSVTQAALPPAPATLQAVLAEAGERLHQGAAAAGTARAAAAAARDAAARAEVAADAARGGRGFAIQYPNGDSYAGEAGRGGLREGVGVYRYANGQSYAGEWRNGLVEGVGVFTFPGGERYEGTVGNGQPDGPGVYLFPNGSRYSGPVPGGRVLGVGELAFSSGAIYRGEVVDRLPTGLGELRTPDGSRHLGRFERGMPDGPGVELTPDGKRRAGRWQGSALLEAEP